MYASVIGNTISSSPTSHCPFILRKADICLFVFVFFSTFLESNFGCLSLGFAILQLVHSRVNYMSSRRTLNGRATATYIAHTSQPSQSTPSSCHRAANKCTLCLRQRCQYVTARAIIGFFASAMIAEIFGFIALYQTIISTKIKNVHRPHHETFWFLDLARPTCFFPFQLCMATIISQSWRPRQRHSLLFEDMVIICLSFFHEWVTQASMPPDTIKSVLAACMLKVHVLVAAKFIQRAN